MRFIGRLGRFIGRLEGNLLGGWRRFIGRLEEIYWEAGGDLLGG